MLGYIRTMKDNQSYPNSNDCPGNMYGISYYWDDNKKKSCTILSQQQSKQSISYTDADDKYLQQHCRDPATEQFLGCIYTSHENCIFALEKPEYVDITEPKKLRVSLSIYLEAAMGAEEKTVNRNDKHADDVMSNANNEDNTAFTVSTKINVAEFSFEFGEISNNFRICSDELFNLQQFLPFLSPETTLKFCLRATNWDTFMPANGELYVSFVPHFSATIRKTASMSSLGFSGGIEYTANPFIAHLNLIQPTNWMDQPDNNAVVREDLKWYEPIVIHSRSDYEEPPDFSIIALIIFLVIMVLYYLYMFKNYKTLKHEEEIMEKKEEERIAEQEQQERQHQEWEKGIMEKDKEYKQHLNDFKTRKSSQLLGDEQLRQRISEIQEKNKISVVNGDEIRKSKLDEYSDIQISEGEMDELMNASVDDVDDKDVTDDNDSPPPSAPNSDISDADQK